MTKTAFESFSCYNFTAIEATADAPGQYCYYLIADPSVECSNLSDNPTTPAAWLAIFIYPVGVFGITAALLCLARGAILESKPTTLSRAVGFLHRDLKPHFYCARATPFRQTRRFLARVFPDPQQA